MGLEQLKRSLDDKVNLNHHGAVLKKNKKPLMERVRRRKINNYLEELKCLVLCALNKEVSLYNKMEKADILDMAVKYIKAVRTHPEVSTTTYREGHEHSPTRSYEIPNPTPFLARPKNIIHDSSSKVGNSNELNVETPRQTCKTEANEQFKNSEKENITRNEQNNLNSETSRTDAGIWRPW